MDYTSPTRSRTAIQIAELVHACRIATVRACTVCWSRRRRSFLGRIAPLRREQPLQRLPDGVPWVFRHSASDVADGRLAAVALRSDLGLLSQYHHLPPFPHVRRLAVGTCSGRSLVRNWQPACSIW